MGQDLSWITAEMFDRKLVELVQERDSDFLLTVPGVAEAAQKETTQEEIHEQPIGFLTSIPGVWEALSEDFNNEVIDALCAERDESEAA